MKKCLVVGIILLFVGITVAPSIHGSVSRTIFEKNNSVPLRTSQSNIKRIDIMKHHLLYIFVYSIIISRYFRGLMLGLLSEEENPSSHPLLLQILQMRAVWLLATAWYLCDFCNDLSDSKGWNWPVLHL
jgi:hypothetical protein